jgi:hypothetical protein
VEGRPVLGSSLVDVLPDLKCTIHNVVYGLNNPLHKLASTSEKSQVFANFIENFMQTRCSSISFTFQLAKIAKGTREKFTLPYVLDD